MSEPARRQWVSAAWPDDAKPYDHLRSLLGVAKILKEYIESRWQDGNHLGLEVLSKTIRQATNALDEHFKTSDSFIESRAAADKTKGDADV